MIVTTSKSFILN